ALPRDGANDLHGQPDPAPARKAYAELKAAAASLGRNPDHLKITTLCHPVVAATVAEGEDKFALIERLPLEVDSLMLLSELTNSDFGSKPLDEPFTDARTRSLHLHTVGAGLGRCRARRQGNRRRATSSSSRAAAGCRRPGSAIPGK